MPYLPFSLNGTYPLSAGEVTTDSTLSLVIAPDGTLSGTIDIRRLKAPTTGHLTRENGTFAINLQTSGQDASQLPSAIDATLQGRKFVGTGTTENGTVACSLDIEGSGALRVVFDITITTDGDGQVSGSGTASGWGGELPIKISGSNGTDASTLHVSNDQFPNFVWDLSGKPGSIGFLAHYDAKAFGVSSSGEGVLVSPVASAPALLGNISTRLKCQAGDNVLIGGFIITGGEPKRVIIRAIGPSLPVSGNLADPKLDLHDSSGAVIASNDNWTDSPDKQAIIDTGVPPPNDKESAIVATLNPGAYTAVVAGTGDTTGVALVEVFDLGQSSNSKLANISTRGFVETGDNVLIGGFIVLGDAPQKVLVRAIGPSLPVAAALLDPELELHDGDGTVLAQNDDWAFTQETEVLRSQIAPSDSREAAIVATVLPGAYTAVVRGANSTTGVALVEAYGLNP